MSALLEMGNLLEEYPWVMADYDPQTALIVVDYQNDFADPKGSLYVAGGDKLVDFINAQIANARDAGAMVVFTQDWHPESTPHFQKDGGIWPVHCIGDSWGSELHPALDAGDDEPRIRKGVGGEDGYSGFTVADPETGAKSATELEPQMRDRGIKRVVVIGLATDYCVKATAIDAASKGFETTVLEDGIRAVNLQPSDSENALEEMGNSGVRLD
jgi:nicotinamidase/pyrazinamidase